MAQRRRANGRQAQHSAAQLPAANGREQRQQAKSSRHARRILARSAAAPSGWYACSQVETAVQRRRMRPLRALREGLVL